MPRRRPRRQLPVPASRAHHRGRPLLLQRKFLESALFRKHRAQINKSTVAPVLDRYLRRAPDAGAPCAQRDRGGQESAEALQIPVSSPVAELRRYACIDDNVVYYARLEFPFRKVRMEFDLLAGR